jgi:hypothetical protein
MENGTIDDPDSVFRNVGIKGIKEKQLIYGYSIFSGLKFKTTSYHHDGKPFYLIITIYHAATGKEKEEQKKEGS